MSNLIIRNETENDFAAVENVIQNAFRDVNLPRAQTGSDLSGNRSAAAF